MGCWQPNLHGHAFIHWEGSTNHIVDLVGKGRSGKWIDVRLGKLASHFYRFSVAIEEVHLDNHSLYLQHKKWRQYISS